MDFYKPPSVGKKILYIRKKKNISIEELSKRSGVSKSMLSQIEQEKTNPTVVTVWKIARSLDINIEKLMDSENSKSIEVIREEDIPVIYSEDKSIIIRINTPIHMSDSLEIYNITAKPHGINKSQPHFNNAEEFITVLSGKLKISAGNYNKILNKGDTARYKADQEHIIENITDEPAEAFLVVWFPKD